MYVNTVMLLMHTKSMVCLRVRTRYEVMSTPFKVMLTSDKKVSVDMHKQPNLSTCPVLVLVEMVVYVSCRPPLWSQSVSIYLDLHNYYLLSRKPAIADLFDVHLVFGFRKGPLHWKNSMLVNYVGK